MHTVLGDLDRAVRALFERELAERGAAGVGVSFDAPTEAWAAGLKAPALNLYLYDVKESREERRVEWDQAPGGRAHGRAAAPGAARRLLRDHRMGGHVRGRARPALGRPCDRLRASRPARRRTHRRARRGRAYEHELRARAAQPPGRRARGRVLERPRRPATRRRSTSASASGAAPGVRVEQAPPVRTQTLRMGMRGRPAAGVEELHRISGTVRGADGEPAAGAWVVLPESGRLRRHRRRGALRPGVAARRPPPPAGARDDRGRGRGDAPTSPAARST